MVLAEQSFSLQFLSHRPEPQLWREACFSVSAGTSINDDDIEERLKSQVQRLKIVRIPRDSQIQKVREEECGLRPRARPMSRIQVVWAVGEVAIQVMDSRVRNEDWCG
ncbi:hypothetical protein D8674_002088 [Pyrus ussuriensis x Pyrus communis]|uniref:Uncharacterized protein n=1 Tax=Pyrus ussuriensis x Pyrus communis TaxID=2448454 RepID=A0A5N5FE02_9ROSA|nr:hypothetical protein D8674_002088 [Pyrus ussuriensis x Pyrus communis]